MLGAAPTPCTDLSGRSMSTSHHPSDGSVPGGNRTTSDHSYAGPRPRRPRWLAPVVAALVVVALVAAAVVALQLRDRSRRSTTVAGNGSGANAPAAPGGLPGAGAGSGETSGTTTSSATSSISSSTSSTTSTVTSSASSATSTSTAASSATSSTTVPASGATTGGTPAPAPGPTWDYRVRVTTVHHDDAVADRTLPVVRIDAAPGALPDGTAAKAEQAVAAEVAALRTAFDADTAGLPTTYGKFGLEVRADVAVRAKWLLAVSLLDVSNFQGAHPLELARSVVVDLRTGTRLGLDDVFRADRMTAVDEAVRTAYLSSADQYVFPEDVAKTRTSDLAWWPARDGLHVQADQCAIAACAAGQPEVTVPWSTVRPMLRPGFTLPW